MQLLSLVVSVIFLETVWTAELTRPCQRNSNCRGENTYCRFESNSCKFGTCECRQGFAAHSSGHCKKPVPLLQPCDKETVCKGEHTACISGVCYCKRFYKVGLTTRDCVFHYNNKKYGESCSTSESCYYDMRCIAGMCQCQPGYRIDKGQQCVVRQIGEDCEGNADCSGIPNTECYYNSCRCKEPYWKISYMKSPTERATTCAYYNNTQGGRGATCDNTVGEYDSGLCRDPLICTKCPLEYKSNCWSINPLLAGSSTVISELSVVAVMTLGILAARLL